MDTVFMDFPGGTGYQVHQGFWNALNVLWPDVLKFLQTNAGGQTPVYLCGPSLGGALAVLAAARLWLMNDPGVNYMQGGFYTFGQPRVGNDAFANAISQTMRGQYYRFVNNLDIVLDVPPAFAGFRHGGTLMYFDDQQNLIAKPSTFTNLLDDWSGEVSALSAFKLAPQLDDHSMDRAYMPALLKNERNNPFA